MADLFGIIKQTSQNRQLGERFGISLEFTNKVGAKASLLFISAAFDCWDSVGNHIVSAYPVALVQFYTNGGVQIRYMMSTGPNQTITQAGTFRYIFTVRTSDGEVTTFEQTALVNTNP